MRAMQNLVGAEATELVHAGHRTSTEHHRVHRAARRVGQVARRGEHLVRHLAEHAIALRDQAVREGDQAYGAVVVRDGIIVGEGRNYVVLQTDPTAHAELLAVRDAARRLGSRDLSQCDVYSTATPCPMCQGALYWARVRRVFTEGGAEEGSAPRLGC